MNIIFLSLKFKFSQQVQNVGKVPPRVVSTCIYICVTFISAALGACVASAARGARRRRAARAQCAAGAARVARAASAARAAAGARARTAGACWPRPAPRCDAPAPRSRAACATAPRPSCVALVSVLPPHKST